MILNLSLKLFLRLFLNAVHIKERSLCCLLYTSDAADEEDSVDFGGRRILKKKKRESKGDNTTYET